MKGIICVDFDGTLVDDENRIHPADEAILRDPPDDVIIIPSTGRALHSVRYVFERSGLFTDCAIPMPMVLQNGATTFLPGEEILSFLPFPVATQKQLISAAMRNEKISYFLFGFDTIHVIYPGDISNGYAVEYAFNISEFNPVFAEPRYSKLMAVTDDVDALHPIVDQFSPHGTETFLAKPTILEVGVQGVNKGQWVLNLIEAMGFSGLPIAAAGDSPNDFPLFEIADYTIAPSDAPETTKKRAREIVDRQKYGVLTALIRAIDKVA